MNFDKLYNKKASYEFDRFDRQDASLPPGFPKFGEILDMVDEQFKTRGLPTTSQLEMAEVGESELEEGIGGRIWQAIYAEAEARWDALVKMFGKPEGVPFLTREANILAGHWLPKIEEAERGRKLEVAAWVANFCEGKSAEEILEYSCQTLSELFHRKTGKTTTRQVIAGTKTIQRARKEAAAMRTAREKRLRKT